MRLDYTFGTTSTGVTMTTSLPVPGTPTSLSVWVRGDGSANPVYMSLTDVTGERFSGTVGSLQTDWQRLTLHLDGSALNWASSGGDGDGRVDYPVTVRAISVYRAGIGILAGSASFDALEANYGPSVRGVVFARRGQTLQALHSMASQTIKVPITGTTAQLVDYVGWRTVAVPSKVVTMTVNPVPRYLMTGPELLPATITPNGDGRSDWTDMRWASGGGSRATLQVYALNGRLLRTVRVGVPMSGGLGSLRWDGKLPDAGGRLAAAPVGKYQLRITVRAPDGRLALLSKIVTVSAAAAG
jgi:hypothetical protein